MKVRRVPRRLFALAVGDNVDPLLLPAAKGLGAPGLAIEDQGQRPVAIGLSTRFGNDRLIDQRQEVLPGELAAQGLDFRHAVEPQQDAQFAGLMRARALDGLDAQQRHHQQA
ncbi:MAG TPA: hypothetical protein DDY14_07740 [Chromatiaceae bacterium]|nr:MAG: hypothetical protein N838_09430 [Thiohalocapsa sp. PB-PSB1]QQO54755.1 MAG: hypothetical protein N838_16825 [Thiohalocapsa sp. PB-PSB1]HBG95205.1 hypothetical protein [Chromatiaceae bacterium]HCS90616.1 hypothetical protein [Chromatiaceae bacterium]